MGSKLVKEGLTKAPHRSLFKASGLTDEEIERPLIGVVNSFNEIVPGHVGLNDITEAVKKLAHRVKDGEISPDDIDDDMISAHLSTAEIPDPELIIRTSGEYRLSNFLLWQLAYSELYITETYWPDFRRDELYKAIQSFQERDRRFGKLSEKKQKKSTSLYVQGLTS